MRSLRQLSATTLEVQSASNYKNMSNYAVWNTRLRHEWLAKPAKGKYLSKRKRSRCGLEDALVRKSEGAGDEGSEKGKSA